MQVEDHNPNGKPALAVGWGSINLKHHHFPSDWY
jgi:hypothetical protein